MPLDYVALVLLIVISVAVIHVAITIHDIPFRIARGRNHPHQDAIRVGGYLSVLTLHALWPLLWIWASMYAPAAAKDAGGAAGRAARQEPVFAPDTPPALQRNLGDLHDRLAALELRAIQEDM